jgi:hypothetical protein
MNIEEIIKRELGMQSIQSQDEILPPVKLEPIL